MPRQSSRRRFISTASVLAVSGLTAGCQGDGGGTDSTPTEESTPTTTRQGDETGTPTSEGTSAGEWREQMSEQAAEELSGGEEVNYVHSLRHDPTLNAIVDGDLTQYGDEYEPLNGNINQVLQTPSNSEPRYVQEMNAGQEFIDVLDATQVDLALAGVEFTDLTEIPSFQEAPDALTYPPYLGPRQAWAEGIAYNTDIVSEPPQSYDDLLSDRFQGNIAVDPSPTEYLEVIFMNQIKSQSYLENLGAQEPNFYDSRFAQTQNVATGEHGVVYHPISPHVASMQADGLPIEWVHQPETTMFMVKPISVAAQPAHPAAAKLLSDLIMRENFQNEVMSVRPGALSIYLDAGEDQWLADLLDELDEQVWTGDDLGVEALDPPMTAWQNAMGIPGV